MELWAGAVSTPETRGPRVKNNKKAAASPRLGSQGRGPSLLSDPEVLCRNTEMKEENPQEAWMTLQVIFLYFLIV